MSTATSKALLQLSRYDDTPDREDEELFDLFRCPFSPSKQISLSPKSMRKKMGGGKVCLCCLCF
ncbi:MAG: hypothetical protein P0S95_07295 [Rhabdochlamydiaceae bacterium]|nr:hypothetical protein [Candidatus Amphrikana amoebophyrae]